MATIISDSNASNGTAKDDNLAQELITKMQAIFGKNKGYRTTHAKGWLVEGTFCPTEEAKKLSIAPHFHRETKVIARFSVGGGIPAVPDADDKATPKGVSIRFQIDEETHTDLIAHSFNGFATRTGEDFLEFLNLVSAFGRAEAIFKQTPKDDPKYQEVLAAYQKAGAALGAFTTRVPSAGVFLKGPKPNPHNYGTITYYEPNTHVLVNDEGKKTNIRYRLDPADGDHLYSVEEAKGLPPNYLEDDLMKRFPDKPVIFTVQAQIAGPDDILDDATKPYAHKDFVAIGKLEFNKTVEDNPEKQQQIAFSPVPTKGGIKGIEESEDPLIQARRFVYYISVDERRSEKRVPPPGAIN